MRCRKSQLRYTGLGERKSAVRRKEKGIGVSRGMVSWWSRGAWSVVGSIDARLATGGWFWCRSKDGRAAPSSSLRSLLSPLLVLSLRLYKGGTVLCESVRPKSIFRFRKDLACTTRHSRLTALLSIRPTVEGCLCLSLPFYPL